MCGEPCGGYIRPPHLNWDIPDDLLSIYNTKSFKWGERSNKGQKTIPYFVGFFKNESQDIVYFVVSNVFTRFQRCYFLIIQRLKMNFAVKNPFDQGLGCGIAENFACHDKVTPIPCVHTILCYNSTCAYNFILQFHS